ncbi:hypothetical protein KI387_043316 [Taxus chinensis]|uniref:Malectin-like domain-containing protein n=1 Tax=Taxus chinensis TaxID=29808 RepID=A0AA38BYS1_TAXCH|nr:hypothetical protein KI387_043316 [Taxus chinensis]
MKVDVKSSTYLFKEYLLINVTSDSLTVTFAPMNNSIAFINSIEVVSVPDFLTSNVLTTLSPLSSFSGLPVIALETSYRLNMGGNKVKPKNDTLGRTWYPDKSYLAINSSVQNVTTLSSSIRYPESGTVTPDIAHNYVYATAEEMGNANVVNPVFNISWVVSVDQDFSYFVLTHFCDIVSRSLNQLYFDVFINSQTVLDNLDLSSKASNLATPYYTDFVVNASGSKKLSISIGPSLVDNVDPNAILNGLEMMKMSNEVGNLDGPYSVNGLKVGPIVGSVVGVVATLGLLAGGYYCFLRSPKSKLKNSPPAWLHLPFHGGNFHSMGSKVSMTSHKSGTGSYVSSA